MGSTVFGWEAPSLGGAACEELHQVQPWPQQAGVKGDDAVFFYKDLTLLLLWVSQGGPKYMDWGVKTSKKNE